ncbi:transcription termination factor 1 isoform X1 [Myiozetetes cayanensis]|uniref:transcription termination factor 1 isoform X1 n=1 Tax=Myiozetetes cayanensis TaxID=478635 RepID=UPI002160D5D1|nr:transcription termination factor 1 isoform X1 [Myiozetetes cayanensis]XP_050175961.1 transcription termination factor 1 isoform X1 [Myiozetetes cayanensis]
MHICSQEKASVFRRHFAKPVGLKKKRKGMARADDSQGQDFLKKRKKKRKHKECNSQRGNEGSGGDPELGRASPPLFENAAAQGEEGSKKKKKQAPDKGKKEQQASIADYCVRMDQEITNGTGVEASQKKRRKQECSESTDEQSDVTCVLVNQDSPGDCQDSTMDYVYIKKPLKKKKKRKAKLPEAGEEHEEPPSQRGSENSGEKAKKKRKKRRGSSAQDGQEDTDGAADQSSPGQNRPAGDKGSPLPAQEGQRHKGGDSDAASATSELSVEEPAGFSTPSKAPNQAQKTPGHAKKTIKSSAFVTEESSSDSDEIRTPEPSASNKKKSQNSSFAEMAASDEVSVDDDEYLDSLTSSFMDLDTARQELKEFIPHVENLSDSSIKKMVGRDLPRFKEFKKQGVAVKFGRFTQKENNQIRKNVEEFLSISGLDSAEKLLFTSRYPEEKATINHLKAEHEFCAKISEGIPRPWRLIYYRARKMFDSNNYKGRYTDEEKEQLKKYQAMHGNDWKKISELMSRSNLSVAMKFSEIKSAVNYGPWTKEEIQKLKHAVKEVVRKRVERGSSPSSVERPDWDLWVDRETLCQQLPWTEIETKVGSRFWRQCKQKWNTILVKKMSKGQQFNTWIKRLQNRITLIKRLYEMKVEDANEVNWEELCDAVGDVPSAYLQSQFYKLKVSFVPFWQNKTFSEIIDFLFQYKLPELEENLRKKHLSSYDLSASQEKKAFRLSDIFDSGEESD